MARQANAIEMLRKDHREVEDLFEKFESADEQEQEELCRQMVDALTEHARIEEEVFYPYLREASDRIDLIEEANVEHATAKQLIAELESGENGVHRQAVVKVLGEYVGHHIREEEENIFPLVEEMGVDLYALGEELLEHREGRGAVGQREPEAIDQAADR
jgi:hemerythrin superfamily protein